MPKLSALLDGFRPSAIAEITDQAAAMREQGRRLYNFSAGQPDFVTPGHICDAATQAMQRGETGYTPVSGTTALKNAIRRKYARDNSLVFETNQIVVGSGAKPLLADVLRTVCDNDDEVVLPTPCWTSHPGMIQLAGATPVLVPARPQDDFSITAEALRASLNGRTRALILNAPSNPCGAMYDARALHALAQVLREFPDVWVITDDLYEYIVYDGERCINLLEVAPDLAPRTVLVNGVSKAYAMTGWRIGYAAGPEACIAALNKIMSQGTGCPSSISQAAAAAALDGPQDCVREFIASYEMRRNRCLEKFAAIDGVDCRTPKGAFYLYPGIEALLGSRTPGGATIRCSVDFVRYLLDDYSVVVVPGAAFELDAHFRMSIATAMDELEAGIDRIAQAVSALH